MELDDPLIARYVEKLRERGRAELIDKVIPNSSLLRTIADMSGRPASEVVEELARLLRERLDPESATAAYSEIFGASDAERALSSLARHLAFWYLKIAEQLGIIRYSDAAPSRAD
ncbi:hypothetical protein [Thermoproteus tenax]|uniref:Uncharacterized protein n=1 Tax=Thermoproteus tenax (strain ATCC 35583 / DSM 2078 / JCM 9277 / NBRC 100435 / Kra 1) TaxID=768679 RepID=G4RPQ8_THETK|nr:hypothetical protein [Thermoproteus tenax]CCC81553.1 conserved hypothetical protein [Thermoproteus tenax Kra 1]